MPWMYILECADGAYYTGSTNGDVAARVWEHNFDDVHSAAFTRKRRPVKLVYAEDYPTVDAAFAREKQVQGWSRRKKLALIEGRADELPPLSRSRTDGGGADP
ncbi:hypothetical protein CW368_03670 [Actinomycetales bacterium SN12]|nr:hypothetical protein CW368_03670 [Actinomycetales bacterium SN12]